MKNQEGNEQKDETKVHPVERNYKNNFSDILKNTNNPEDIVKTTTYKINIEEEEENLFVQNTVIPEVSVYKDGNEEEILSDDTNDNDSIEIENLDPDTNDRDNYETYNSEDKENIKSSDNASDKENQADNTEGDVSTNSENNPNRQRNNFKNKSPENKTGKDAPGQPKQNLADKLRNKMSNNSNQLKNAKNPKMPNSPTNAPKIPTPDAANNAAKAANAAKTANVAKTANAAKAANATKAAAVAKNAAAAQKALAAKTAVSTAVKAALTNPYVLAAIAIILIIFLFIILIVVVLDNSSDSSSSNFSSYNTYNPAYWVPIGSYETEEVNGVTMATGMPSTSYIDPVYGLFGPRTLFGAYDYHTGIDISRNGVINIEHNIIASRSGTIVKIDDKTLTTGYGKYVIIDHGDAIFTQYAHLDSISVELGDTVVQGQVIGIMGTTGNSTGIHLHFEVRVGANLRANAVDPLDYIELDTPRPVSYVSDGSGFNVLQTSLSKTEYSSKLRNYSSTLSGVRKTNFDKYFVANSDLIYETSIEYNLNPEIIVSYAYAETENFYPCGSYNFWGYDTPNGANCSQAAQFSSMKDGVIAMAKLMNSYSEVGSDQYNRIMSRYEERKSNNCDPAGYGTPDTIVGIVSIYTWLGNYLTGMSYTNEGVGGCYYLDYWTRTGTFMPEKYTQEYFNSRCGSANRCQDSNNYTGTCSGYASTVCEQSDYTAYGVKTRVSARNLIFG